MTKMKRPVKKAFKKINFNAPAALNEAAEYTKKMILRKSVFSCILIASMAFTLNAQKSKFTPLFDGKSLEGWKVRSGSATYKVEDGAIVGTTTEGSGNTFLCTLKEYSDFVLEFEVKFDPEMAFGYACSVLLIPGLVGLMLAAIVAANMSACSNFMVNTGALFTQNFYKKYVNPEAPDKILLRMGRYSGLGLSALAVLFALSIKNVLHAFLFTETLAAFMGIIFLGGIIWKRANRFGAAAALIISISIYYISNFISVNELMLVYKWKPAPFGWAMLSGFFGFWLVSILTKPEDNDKNEAFFDNMRRKSDASEMGKDGKKPLASETGDDLILLDLPSWGSKERWSNFFKRYREDLIGFFLSWLVVGALILLAWGILQI